MLASLHFSVPLINKMANNLVISSTAFQDLLCWVFSGSKVNIILTLPKHGRRRDQLWSLANAHSAHCRPQDELRCLIQDPWDGCYHRYPCYVGGCKSSAGLHAPGLTASRCQRPGSHPALSSFKRQRLTQHGPQECIVSNILVRWCFFSLKREDPPLGPGPEMS